jgi:hypothetical protein
MFVHAMITSTNVRLYCSSILLTVRMQMNLFAGFKCHYLLGLYCIMSLTRVILIVGKLNRHVNVHRIVVFFEKCFR